MPLEGNEQRWEQVSNEDGSHYYYNSVTGESSWHPPAGWETLTANEVFGNAATLENNTKSERPNESGPLRMAEGWSERSDEDGNIYYWHQQTGESTWEFPAVTEKSQEQVLPIHSYVEPSALTENSQEVLHTDPNPESSLPEGWAAYTDDDDNTYYHHSSGKVQWNRPVVDTNAATILPSTNEETESHAPSFPPPNDIVPLHPQYTEQAQHTSVPPPITPVEHHSNGTIRQEESRDQNHQDKERRETEKYRKYLTEFYTLHCPEKVTIIETILSEWQGNYPLMVEKLTQKYSNNTDPQKGANVTGASLDSLSAAEKASKQEPLVKTDTNSNQAAQSSQVTSQSVKYRTEKDSLSIAALDILRHGLDVGKKFNSETGYKRRHLFLNLDTFAICWAKGSSQQQLKAAKSYSLIDITLVEEGPPARRKKSDEQASDYERRTVSFHVMDQAIDLMFDTQRDCSTWRIAIGNIIEKFHESSDFDRVRGLLSDRKVLGELVLRGSPLNELTTGGAGKGQSKRASISNYAQDNFTVESNAIGMFSSKKKLVVTDLVNHSTTLITQPLTAVPASLKPKALQAYAKILSYMGDTGKKSGRKSKSGSGKGGDARSNSTAGDFNQLMDIVKMGIDTPALRNEIYCQLVKQTRSNPTYSSEVLGWKLLVVASSYFLPHQDDLLFKCLRAHGRKRCFAPNAVGGLSLFLVNQFKDENKSASFAEIKESQLSLITEKFIPDTVFGVSCEQVLLKEAYLQDPDSIPLTNIKDATEGQAVPNILVFLCTAIVDNHAMEAAGKGVFRLAGDINEVENLRDALAGGDYGVLQRKPLSPIVLADVLKIWIRSIAPPLIPVQLYEPCVAAGRDRSISGVSAIRSQLSGTAEAILIHLSRFFNLLATASKTTLMDNENFALILAPNLLREPSGDPSKVLANVDAEKNFILLVFQIFSAEARNKGL